MGITVEATFERGILKPAQPLPFKENQRLRITIDSVDDVVSRTYGMFGWAGDAATIEYFALNPELDPQEG